MLTPLQIQTKIDLLLNVFAPRMDTLQVGYLATHGAYWQGLTTHSALPNYTVTDDPLAPGDRRNLVAGSVVGSWLDNFPSLSPTTRFSALRMDVYDGPSGRGYALVSSFNQDGDTYEKTAQVGPETHRDEAWHKII